MSADSPDYEDDRGPRERDRDRDRDRDDSRGAVRRAQDRTNLPGVFLIICGAFNILGALGSGGIAFRTWSLTPAQFEFQQREAAKLLPPNMQEQIKNVSYEDQRRQGVLIYGISAVALLVVGILGIIGGIRMRQLRSYGLAMTSAILTALPCVSVSGACCFGLALGIWSIVVLANSDVRAQFR